MLKGGCYCGAVRYECSEPVFHETICHCSICRRTSGAPMVAWFSVERANFRFVSGTPTRFDSTDTGQRTFCGRCGTQLTFTDEKFGGEIDVTLSSLDDPNVIAPRDHTWTRSKLVWVQVADGLPQFSQARDSD